VSVAVSSVECHVDVCCTEFFYQESINIFSFLPNFACNWNQSSKSTKCLCKGAIFLLL